MPLTSVTKDVATLTLTIIGDYPVSQQRLWDAFTDPRQLERFWGPPDYPVTFTRHDLSVGGRAEYVMTRPSWRIHERFLLQGMEDGLRAALPQLDAVLAEPSPSVAH